MHLSDILEDCKLTVSGYETLSGGDINKAYCLQATGTRYFLKVNDAGAYPGLFEKEVNGLQALRQHSTLLIPTVIRCGNIKGRQYLLLEWLQNETGYKNYWDHFGKALALLHQHRFDHFGWPVDNYIGSLVQQNAGVQSWPLFYENYRIMPLVRQLFNAGSLNKKDLASAELLCKHLEQLFPAEPPALVHGDLWSGNFMVTTGGKVAVFDPAVYYGHREMDIGMTQLFGGFNEQFYTSYQEIYPLEKGWKQRLAITQLYPLLVHAILFGGGYIGSVRQVLRPFLPAN